MTVVDDVVVGIWILPDCPPPAHSTAQFVVAERVNDPFPEVCWYRNPQSGESTAATLAIETASKGVPAPQPIVWPSPEDHVSDCTLAVPDTVTPP
ncbi:hypothetical protein DC31_06260 [Microbacterium sp. CH12i]|nr:hypothetical protein DC31_06260 [Microbacterium sp. CH12i]